MMQTCIHTYHTHIHTGRTEGNIIPDDVCGNDSNDANMHTYTHACIHTGPTEGDIIPDDVYGNEDEDDSDDGSIDHNAGTGTVGCGLTAMDNAKAELIDCVVKECGTHTHVYSCMYVYTNSVGNNDNAEFIVLFKECGEYVCMCTRIYVCMYT
jgi:hypothetical protein